MSVPTISAVTPGVVPTLGGGLVRVTGTGFRLYEPPAGGYVGPHGPAVAVLFAGVAAATVEVLSATELWARVPPYAGAPEDVGAELALTVQNLNDDGTPIPLEVATKAKAFAYRYVDMTGTSTGLAAHAALLALLRREITPWVYHLTAADYDDSPDALDRVAEPAQGPYLVVVGPDYRRQRRARVELSYVDEGSDRTTAFREAAVRDLTYAVHGGASGAGSTRLAMNLRDVLVAWGRRELALTVTDGAGQAVRCRVFPGFEWSWQGGPDAADRRRFQGELTLDAVPIDLAGGLVDGKTAVVEETELTTEGV